MAEPSATARARGAPFPIELPSREHARAELTTEVVTTVDGVRALRADYERLARLAGNTLPFALPEWHLTWCAHFLHTRPAIEDQLLFHVLRRSSGECAAIVPLVYSRWHTGPLRVATADMIGADAELSEIRTPLIEPGFEAETVDAVHDSLQRMREWDWIHWRGMSAPLAAAVCNTAATAAGRVVYDFVLDLPPSWSEFRAGLKRNIRESLRHCYNSLRRDGHRFEFVVARNPAEIGPALERFLELHALRAAMKKGPRHPDRFASRSQRDFLYEVCAALAARDVVRVFQLQIGGSIVAARVGFVVGDSVYLYYSGFDPVWARYSVMTTTVAETLRYAIAHGLRFANLSPNPEQSKLRWRPRPVEFHSALLHRDTFGSQLACRAYRATLSESVSGRMLRGLLRARRRWG